MSEQIVVKHTADLKDAPEEFRTAIAKLVISHAVNELYGALPEGAPIQGGAFAPGERGIVFGWKIEGQLSPQANIELVLCRRLGHASRQRSKETV